MKVSRGAQWAGVLVAVAVPAACLLAFPGSVVYWGSEARIEHYLRGQTPIGSSQATVQKWLRGRGAPADLFAAAIPPHSVYPPTDVGGESFIHSMVGHYWTPFETDEEALYTFDADGKLVDIRVRQTVDAP